MNYTELTSAIKNYTENEDYEKVKNCINSIL